MNTISLIGIIVGVAFMIWLAWKGVIPVIFGIAAAAIVILFSGLPIVTTLTDTYMTGFVGFAKNYFFIFLLSSIFGKLMSDSGAARVIAAKMARVARKAKTNQKFIVLVVFALITLVLTLGGVSGFVVYFIMVSLGRNLFEELDIPWHFYMATTFTAAMGMIPGNPSIQNLIPMTYLGTAPTAAPVLGTILTIVCMALSLGYIKIAVNRSERLNEHFLPTGTVISGRQFVEEDTPDYSLIYCLIPSIVLLVLLNVVGTSPVTALFAANVLAYIMFRKSLKGILKTLEQGSSSSIIVLINTCAVIGFGSVVTVTPGYDSIVQALDNIPGPPLVQLAIIVNIIAGFSGSGSAGINIALTQFAQKFLDAGINAQVIHRIAVTSCSGLGALPHNGSIISGLQIAGLTHKQGYKHLFFLMLVIPIIVAALGIVLAGMGIV